MKRNTGPELREALDTGYAVLARGGASLDAVVAAIKVLEDSPLFNAGHGAAMNAEGVCELDASIMDGRTQDAGAVAGVQHIRNPITLARDVLERTPHIMLIGDGAEAFARQLGYEFVPNKYFQTARRRRQLQLARELERRRPAPPKSGRSGSRSPPSTTTNSARWAARPWTAAAISRPAPRPAA